MRNFEADKLVRIGDVMDILEKSTRNGGRHEVDLGDFGWEYVDCESTVNLGDVTTELLGAAERLESA